MRIAIASGKGGTGKTTVAVNLAYITSKQRQNTVLLDCDVEEPNTRLFLDVKMDRTEAVTKRVPSVETSKCNLCDQCTQICRFNAIALVAGSVRIYPELCHACGACTMACPTGAITEVDYEIGWVHSGTRENLKLVEGELKVGQPQSPPVIRAVHASAPEAQWVIVDAPPGTSCPAVASIRGSDLVVLVTDPTPFGLHDLKLALDMVRQLGLPCTVVVNRATGNMEPVYDICRLEGIKIALEIPDSRELAEACSRGELFVKKPGNYKALFLQLMDEIKELLA